VETIIQRGRETYSDARPRMISDSGPQFITKEIKEFIRIRGMAHVKTSPFIPKATVSSNAGLRQPAGNSLPGLGTDDEAPFW
jgi:hypothetical protein